MCGAVISAIELVDFIRRLETKRHVNRSKADDRYQTELWLDGHMIDEVRLKDETDILIFRQEILSCIEHDVDGGQGLLRCQTPDVKFVNADYTGDLTQRASSWGNS